MGHVTTVIEDIVGEHAVRVATLWEERHRLVNSRVQDLVSLDDLDRELSAHIEALVLAGDVGWEIAEQFRVWADPADAFAGLVVALRLGNRGRIEDVVGQCDRSDLLPGLVSAIGWSPLHVVRRLLDDWSEYDGPRWRALALAGHVAHRHDAGRTVDKGLIHTNIDVRQQAARAAGFLDRRELVPVLKAMSSDQSASTRFVAARALLQLRSPDAVEALLSYAEAGGPRAEIAAELALRSLPPPDAEAWFARQASRPGGARCLVAAAAASGLPQAIPWLLPAMDVAETAQLAGHGFASITGVDLEDADLIDDEMEDEAGLGDSPDEGLPWPNRAKIEAWWSRHRRSFRTARRWRQGRPQSARVLRELLLTASQHERGLVAHDLLRMHRAHVVPFETHAPAWRQHRWLMPLHALFDAAR